MSDYRNTNAPLGRRTPEDLNARGSNGSWGWAAGAVLVIALLALAFGLGHTPNQHGTNVAANNLPTMNQPAPAPGGPANPAYTPTPMNPANNPGNPAPLNPVAPQIKL